MLKILITGGTGTLGNALIKNLCKNPKLCLDKKIERIIVYSRDEYKQHLMQQAFNGDKDYENVRFFIGDVRDEKRLTETMEGVDIVIHAAALKQIPACEYNPQEPKKTNIDGTMNVINACIATGVKKAVLISTDKAVRPVNLYGATKMVAEKLFKAANAYNKTKFSVVRYGNVIASRGSVIELFQRLKRDEVAEFPITSLDMTRFWISVDDAVALVMKAVFSDYIGLFIPKISAMKMTDVATAIEPACTFKDIGIREGEKLHEDLTCSEDGEYMLVDFAGESKICKGSLNSSENLTMTQRKFQEMLYG